MENLQQYIKPELLILIPVLYILGLIIKQIKAIKDKYIPAILGVVGVALSLIYLIATEDFTLLCVFTSITQGILITGVAVYANQLIKQLSK